MTNFAERNFRGFAKRRMKSMKINPFVPNAAFLYPLKALENHKVYWCFQGVEKGCTGIEQVNPRKN